MASHSFRQPLPGELAIVLHTHMPYVEGYGTWPFGEEWLWEAIATSYLPLLDVLETGGPVTLSVTPVLADQLEALRDDPAIADRFLGFLRDVRADTHARDVEGLRARDVRRPHRRARLRGARARRAPTLARWAAARTDRPRHARARLEPPRLPRPRHLPRLPPPHEPPPSPVGQRRLPVRPRGGAGP